jgi:PKD repeat protein
LATFLDGGGRLFLSSQGYLYDFGRTPFGEAYLGIGSYLLGAGDALSIVGVAGDPVGDGLGPYALNYPGGFIDHGDILYPTTTASLAFEGDNGHPLNIDVDGQTWRTVFFATSWVPIQNSSTANGAEVLGRIISWFGGCMPCEPVHDVDFVWKPLTPTVGQVITFTASATGTTPITYSWKLDVGCWKAGELVSHTYNLPGIYQVALTATNCVSATATAAHTITVLPEPCEPVHDVDFDWVPFTPTTGQVVTFTGIATGTFPITYGWRLEVGGWREGKVVTYSYALPGLYTVTLTATNCLSATAQASSVLTVLPKPVESYSIYLPLVNKRP